MPTARAVFIRAPGDADVLELGSLEVRDPGPHEVLVAVAAAGLNRADVLQRKGFYPAPPGVPKDVPGLELAGTVAAIGEGVTSVKVGDRVMAIAGGGAMSSLVVAHERELIPVPAGMSLTDAAAIPEAFLTAWDALSDQAQLGAGEVVLLHAVASGVGTAAIQLARIAGAISIGTSRSPGKLDRCVDLGLDHAVHAEGGRFAGRVFELTHGRGADVILDTVGAAYLEENVRAVAAKGRIVTIGLLGGAAATLPLAPLLAKRASIRGTVLRSRPLEEKASLARTFATRALPLFATGKLRPIVDAVLPIADVREAHRRMEANETFGKLVLAFD